MFHSASRDFDNVSTIFISYDFVSWAELALGVLYKFTYINKLNIVFLNKNLKGKVSQHSYYRVLIDLVSSFTDIYVALIKLSRKLTEIFLNP